VGVRGTVRIVKRFKHDVSNFLKSTCIKYNFISFRRAVENKVIDVEEVCSHFIKLLL